MAINFLDGISVDGSVGIGTTSPDSKLEVASTANATYLHVRNDSTGQTRLKMSNSSDTNSNGFQIINNASNGQVNLLNYKASTLALWTNGSEKMTILSGGNVGIGTTSPAEKLAVAGNIRVTGVGNALNLDTLGSAGTNGIKVQNNYETVVYTGRGSAGFAVIGNANIRLGFGAAATTSNADLLINSSGLVGIGTVSPVDKLHVSSGMIRVEGVGCGIRMPDTSGNPLLALTTDQNTFAGCNIVNGWGNSSNTGVGVGTTRSDGTAFQVRTGITLSSGIATSSGTQRLIVYGNGGTKITKSLGVGANASATTGRIDASNDIVAYSSSDIRLKDNIKSIDKALDKVNKIQGIEFDWIEKEEVHGNSGHDVGVIAQEIEKVLPEVVDTRDNGYKAVKYEKLVPLLIEAIKDLSKQVDGLKRLI